MENFKNRFVIVACERFSGMDLSATHRVFPAVAWVAFYVHIFFSLNIAINNSVSANYFFQVFCSIGSYDWVTRKCFSCRSVVRYCQRYTTDIVVILGFLK